MKKIFFVIMFIITCFNFNIKAEPLNPYFDDDNFYRCVIDNLNENKINDNSDRDFSIYKINDDELNKLQDLACVSYFISSLKGLEKIPNLTYINLEDNNIETVDLSHNKFVNYIYVDNEVEVLNYDGEIEREGIYVQNNSEGISMESIISLILIYIVITIGLILLFLRLNQKIWIAFIPIYNFYILIKTLNLPIWHLVLMLIPIINFYSLYKIGLNLADKFNKNKKIAILFMLFPWIMIFIIALSKDNNYEVDNIMYEEMNQNVKIENEPITYGISEQDINHNYSNMESQVSDQINDLNITANSQINFSDNQIKTTSNNIEKEYKICQYCGNKIKKDANICFFCGNEIPK